MGTSSSNGSHESQIHGTSRSQRDPATAFAAHFREIEPLILSEWPQIGRLALQQTSGDYETVVALIANQTDHTETLVKRQLDELSDIATSEGKSAKATVNRAMNQSVRKLRDTMDQLQSKSQEIADYVRRDMATDARTKAHENPFVTLLMALGLGLILGFVLRGLGRGRA